MKHWQESKAWILNTANVAYPREGPPSGQNGAGIMLQIRETIWRDVFWKKRATNIKQAIYRRNKKPDGIKLSANEIEAETIATVNDEKKKGAIPDVIDTYFYPKHWLAFNYLGTPCLFQSNSSICDLKAYSTYYRPTTTKEQDEERAERQELALNIDKSLIFLIVECSLLSERKN